MPLTQNWFPDTDATHHVTPEFFEIQQLNHYKGGDQLYVGNGTGFPIQNTGNSYFPSHDRTFHFKCILHVSSITKPLLSVQKFSHDNNVFFEFHVDCFFVKDPTTKKVLLSDRSKNGLYTLPIKISSSFQPFAYLSSKASSDCWHLRLGHPHQRILHQVLKKYNLPVSSLVLHKLCSACQLGKSHKLSLSISSNKISSILQLLYTDVWGPSPFLSSEGHRYFLVIVDDYTNLVWGFSLF